jgi:pimeloyl-ACP methyl ester carboxylesterase
MRIARRVACGLLAIAGLLAVAVGVCVVAARIRETATVQQIAPDHGRFVATRTGRMFVQEAGPADGMPVLLVHGTAVWSEVWRPAMATLAAAGYRAIAFDVPPFGFSERLPSPAFSRADQAERIVALFDALGIERAIVVAHSIGARGPAEALFRAPQRIAGLVLVCGALGLGSGAPPAPVQFVFDHSAILDPLVATLVTNPLMTKTLFARLLARKEAADDNLVRLVQMPMRLRDSTHDFGAWLGAMFTPDPQALSLDRARYREIKTPVALIWGDKDEITPLEQARDLQSLIPQASLRIIAETGHVPQIEDFAAFRSALMEALREMPQR